MSVVRASLRCLMSPPLHSSVLPSLDFPDAELVFATVSAVGTPDHDVNEALVAHLRQLGYSVTEVSMSSMLPDVIDRFELDIQLRDEPEFSRVATRMDAGTKAREQIGGEVLALCAIQEINSSRQRESDAPLPTIRRAHVLRSLKHPDEVAALRKVYGDGFFLIGIHCPRELRRKFLEDDKYLSEDEAEELMLRDEDEGMGHGQHFVKTFHLADFFVAAKVNGDQEDPRAQIRKFVNLVFGDPHQFPTRDEQAMYLAFASALRSADLARQVGAVLTSSNGDVLSVGANDVPSAFGGLYWPGSHDQRDHVRGYDSNSKRREEILDDVLSQCASHFGVSEVPSELRAALASGPIGDLTEYGRAVHAEMEAIISCSRSGASSQGGTLYTTTFPCHNCAKHIVCAGIERVVFVEPYSKSQALTLHDDSIVCDPSETDIDATDATNCVRFEHFVGVGPRRFMDLFSMRLSTGAQIKRKSGADKVDWAPRFNSAPRIPMRPISYLDAEEAAVAELAAFDVPQPQPNDTISAKED